MADEPKESEVVKALKEQYEQMMAEQREQYERKLEEQRRDYTETIKTILTSGARPVTDIPEVPQEESEEDTITANLRKKFRLDK